MATILTHNFSLEEMYASAKAKENCINNIPDDNVINNLRKLCEDILQPIRTKYGHAITVLSGYRCPQLNDIVGGIKTSQHLLGEAADIKCTATTKSYLFNLIKNMIENGEITVGQLIWEYGTKKEPNWIHISLPYKTINQILYLYSK